MSQLGGTGEEGRWGGREGEVYKRDQLLFAHKPQVDNEWRAEAGWGGEISWQEPLPAKEPTQNPRAPPSATPHSRP